MKRTDEVTLALSAIERIVTDKWGLTEIAAELKMSEPDLVAMLDHLVSLNWLEKSGDAYEAGEQLRKLKGVKPGVPAGE